MNHRTKIGVMLTALLMIAALVFSGCDWLEEDEDEEVSSKKKPPSTETTTISGTVAAGAPVVGYIRVKGADGNIASADIEADGSYELDVSSLTAPYVLRASGTVLNESISLYSTGVVAGTINITPITSYITSRIVDDLDDAFENWSTASSTVDTEAIETAEATVKEQLAPILEAYSITDEIDLLNTEFDTDQSGIDAVLDILDVTIDGSNEVTITNKATGTAITGDETFSEDEGTALVTVISETAAMNIIWSKFTQVFADEAATAGELDENVASLIATDFLNGGEDRDDKLNELANMYGALSFVTSIDQPMDTSEFSGSYSKGYWINMSIYAPIEDELFLLRSSRTAMVFNGSNWLWYGDQMWFSVDIDIMTIKKVDSSDTSTFMTGLHFELDLNNNYAYNEKGVRSVILTGAGLPSGGLVFEPDTSDEKLNLYSVSSSYDSDLYLLENDDDIANIPENAEYTISAYTTSHETVSLSDTALVTYKLKIKGKPYLNTELKNSVFPIFTSHTTHAVLDLDVGSEIGVSWTLPADADVGWKNRSINVVWGDDSDDLHVEKFLDLTTITSTTADTTTNDISGITWANLSLEGFDVYGRYLILEWEYN